MLWWLVEIWRCCRRPVLKSVKPAPVLTVVAGQPLVSGGIVVVAGATGSGKVHTALRALAVSQAQGLRTAWLPGQTLLRAQTLQAWQVDPHHLWQLCPGSAAQLLPLCLQVVRRLAPVLLVCDVGVDFYQRGQSLRRSLRQLSHHAALSGSVVLVLIETVDGCSSSALQAWQYYAQQRFTLTST